MNSAPPPPRVLLTFLRLPAMLAGLLLGLGAGASAHPLDARIWDTRTSTFIDAPRAYDLADRARYVLLGERHDNPAHQQLQLAMLAALDARGRDPALAMEQFDSEHQAALDAAREARIRNPERLADAGRLDREGWRWPSYKPLVEYAARSAWPIVAANLSRAAAREIALGHARPALPPADAAQQAALEADIVDGHCGHRLPPAMLARIVAAQRARDQRMAAVLDETSADPVVLIAGAGHVRRDRAVPRYLARPDAALTIAYVETRPGTTDPADYDAAGYDLLWFTPAVERPDPCVEPIVGKLFGAAQNTR